MTKRKDGLWQEVYQERDKYGGKVGKPKYFYGHTKSEVLQKLREWEEIKDRGVLFKEAAKEWSKQHEKEVSYHAHRSYSMPYNSAVEAFGDMPIKTITPLQIHNYMERKALQGFTTRTLKGYLSVIRLIYKHAILNGYCDMNTADSVSVPQGAKSTPRELPTAEDIERVKNSVDKTFGLFAYFLLYTGCRRGEALALTHEDIDFQNRTITINKSMYWEGNTPVLKTPKTKAGERTIILLDALAEKIPPGKGYLFGGDKPLTSTIFRHRWTRYKKESGITLTPHQLRHYFATILYDCEIDEKTTQQLMGHSSISVTRDIYTHIRQSRLTQAASKLNKSIKI